MAGRRYFVIFITIFSLFMGGSFSAASLLITSNLIATKQIQHKALIEQFAIGNFNDDAKLLSKQLKATIHFESLTIKDTNNNVLYRYIKNKEQLPKLSIVLKELDLFTSIQRIKTSPGNLVIEFQPSYEQILTPLGVISFIAFIAPIMLCTLIYTLTRLVSEKKVEIIAQYLEALTSFSVKKEQRLLSKSDIKPFKKVIDGVEQLKDNPVIKYENPNEDSLTKLPSGSQFVQDFSTKLHTQIVHSPQLNLFVMVRSIGLQQINLTQGYPAGNQYLLAITHCLKNYAASKKCALYKVNGFDFAAIFSHTDQPKQLENEITQLIKSHLASENIPFDISLVVIEIDKNTELQQLLSQADSQMEFKAS